MTTRRQLIKALSVTSLLSGLSVPVLAQGALRSTPLGEGLTLISGAGANVLVAEGRDAVVVVNGGLREHAEALLAEIHRLTGNKPITALFNTSWRPEYCGLNYLLGPQSTRIIAHENTRLWQGAEFHVDWQGKDYEPMPVEAQANDTFYTKGSLMLDDETVEYGFISQANTDGDIYVRFSKANVLVAGAMLGTDSYLLLDYVTGGWISGAQKTTAGLIAMADADTRVIAAHGGVQGVQQLQEQLVMLEHAYEKVSWAFQNGKSLEEFKATDPMQDFRARWGDPELFLTLLYRGTWYHVPGRAVRLIV